MLCIYCGPLIIWKCLLKQPLWKKGNLFDNYHYQFTLTIKVFFNKIHLQDYLERW